MADGKLTFSSGSSRSGKSIKIMKEVAKNPRVLVFDEKDEWARPWDKKKEAYDRTKLKRGWKVAATKAELMELIKASGDRWKIAYVPKGNLHSNFDFWCRLAYSYGKKKPITIIAEELADVTTPAKAPDAWGNICRKILGFGCDVYAISQRPSESDKTAMGNASIVRTGRLRFLGDQEKMAKQIGVPLEEVKALKPMEFIQCNEMNEISRGITKI